MSLYMDNLNKANSEVNKTIIKIARAVKQTEDSINDLENRPFCSRTSSTYSNNWSKESMILQNLLIPKYAPVDVLRPKGMTGPKNPGLYKTQWCRNILSKGVCNFGDECWFVHESSELRAAPPEQKLMNEMQKLMTAVPLFDLSESALYNRRASRF
ncbi:hypothetical protein Mgra_00002470 [Meloidogyne graminicola]|uniref:C3H1-type domain-containing protein n=1 Tax=Meloidogyne graminicola TaxID=189291 RepID=A0A8S9ZWM2_9BILA|nr:hypothetical protein Mgra_00002470 [Meloidogyne graminicola]